MVIEAFLIVAMASLNFSVMARCSGTNSFVFYSDCIADHIKRMNFIVFLHMSVLRVEFLFVDFGFGE